MGRSLVLFESAIKSEVTKKSYLWNLNKFLEWAKLPDPDGLLQLKESYLQTMLEDYILYLRKKVSPNSINAMHAPLQLFFEMNEKKLDFKKIRRLFPAKNKKSGYNAWQTEDIKLMLQQTISKRNRALIHFLASAGCRIGALLDLKLKHLSQIENCKSVLFYPDTNDEYWGFLTPEASKALDEYQEERIRDGESLNQESPLFRTSYQIGIQKPLPLSHSSIKNVISRVSKDVSKMRHKTSKTRYNIQMDHGFRKRFATIIKLDNRISFSVSERLLGHQAYLDPEYFRSTKENLFKEFKKVVADLTITDSERKEAENQKLKQNLLGEQKLEAKIADLEARLNSQNKDVIQKAWNSAMEISTMPMPEEWKDQVIRAIKEEFVWKPAQARLKQARE